MAGLTLVELLVVMSVIAVLAGIVLVGYNAVQARTFDTAVQADLASNAKTLTEYYSQYGLFPTEAQMASLTTKLGFTTSNYETATNAVLYCRSTDGSKMSLIGESKTGKAYYVTNAYRTPRPLSVSFPQGMATDCTNTGVTDPSNGTSGNRIHTSATGWDSWVK